MEHTQNETLFLSVIFKMWNTLKMEQLILHSEIETKIYYETNHGTFWKVKQIMKLLEIETLCKS